MPQPKTKARILKRLRAERRRLERYLAALKRSDMVRPGVVGPWSVKDIIAHLADWQARMPVWMEGARRGELVETPEPGLTWKQLNLVNQRIYLAHCRQPLGQVLDDLNTTFSRFMELVEAMPEDEMLEPGRYSFTGRAAVYDWLSGYAAHDLWAKTKIRKWMRASGRLKE